MSYDVFLSYNSEDVEVVRELDSTLRARGIQTYVDTSELVPGRPWLPDLEKAIEKSRSVAVLVGAAGLGPWERLEAQAFLARAVREGVAVIPVSLPGGPTPEGLPVLLSNFGWVDLRDGLESEGLERLVWGIRGERPEALAAMVDDRPGWRRRSMAEVELHAKLSDLSPQVFEELVYRLQIPWWTFPSYGELGRGERLEQVVEYLRGDPERLRLARRRLAKIRAERSPWAQLRQGMVAGLAWIAPWLYSWCLDRGIVRPEPVRQALDDYLEHFVSWMEAENAGDLVQLSSVELEASHPLPDTGDYGLGLPLPRLPAVRHIRNRLRELAGLSDGGDQATAQLASVHRQTRKVRDAVRVLRWSREPVVLLGDPGSGKSMTLRAVGRALALEQQRRYRPALVVYVRLGGYRSRTVGGQPEGVFELVRSAIVTGARADRRRQHPLVWKALPFLIATRRVVVLFDGMDEMERQHYGERVAILSRFAQEQRRSIKSLFACRINDFSPEMRHRQLVLLPFDRARVTEYVSKNLPLPRTLEGTEYRRPRALTRALWERSALAEMAANPLMLFLICRFLAEPGADRWPIHREELFSGYIRRVVLRARRGDKLVAPAEKDQDRVQGDLTAAEIESLAELGRLAYEITTEGSGSVGNCTALAERCGDGWLEAVLRFGEACGLLFHEDDKDQVRFTHHRLQEYFTARHLATESHEMAWDQVLDHPRWQETLLNLVALGGGRAAVTELSKSLEAASGSVESRVSEGQRNGAVPTSGRGARQGGKGFGKSSRHREEDWPLDAEEEKLLADRVVLASQVLRESKAMPDLVPDRLARAYSQGLGKIATHGRPSSQVKALWAWRAFAPAGVSFVEVMAGILTSRVRWVRDQAVLLAGGSNELDRGGSNLAFEFGFDLVHGHLFKRLGVYSKSILNGRRWRWVPPLLLAVFCELATLLLSAFGCILVALEFAERYPAAALDSRGLWVALVVFQLPLIGVLVWRGLRLSLALALSTAGGCLLIRLIHNAEAKGLQGLLQVFLELGLFVGAALVFYFLVWLFFGALYGLACRRLLGRAHFETYLRNLLDVRELASYGYALSICSIWIMPWLWLWSREQAGWVRVLQDSLLGLLVLASFICLVLAATRPVVRWIQDVGWAKASRGFMGFLLGVSGLLALALLVWDLGSDFEILPAPFGRFLAPVVWVMASLFVVAVVVHYRAWLTKATRDLVRGCLGYLVKGGRVWPLIQILSALAAIGFVFVDPKLIAPMLPIFQKAPEWLWVLLMVVGVLIFVGFLLFWVWKILQVIYEDLYFFAVLISVIALLNLLLHLESTAGRRQLPLLALGLVLLTSLALFFRAVRLRLVLRAEIRNSRPRVHWVLKIRDLDARGQALVLRRLWSKDFGDEERSMTPEEFLTLLEEVEPAIQKEPAASVYWRLRHELEQTLRLDRS